MNTSLFLFKKQINTLASGRQHYSAKVNKNMLEIFKLIKEIKRSQTVKYLDELEEIIKNDKKRIKDKFNFVLLNDIGSSYISDEIKSNQIQDILKSQ